MAEEVKKLLDEYRDGRISRRDFIHKAALLTGSLALANSLLDPLIAPAAYAAQVDPGDPGLASSDVKYAGKAGTVFGYLSRPKASGKYPAVIVIHENRGINDHIRDVARRFSKEGYVALAPDYLSRHGGTATANPKGGGIGKMRELVPWQGVAEDTDATVAYLKDLPEVRGDRIGVVGFCWGGEMAFLLATEAPDLKAAVVYYGGAPSPSEMARIRGPVLAFYGTDDMRLTSTIAPAVAEMKKLGKSFETHIYEHATHAFLYMQGLADNNKATADSWPKAIAFLKQHMK